jgi:membrane protease YdiL (CAAX protease family)
MNNSLKIPSARAQFWFLIGMLAGGTLLTIFVFQAISTISHTPVNTASLGMQRTEQVLYSILAFLLPAYVFSLIVTTQPPAAFLGFKPAPKGYFYALGVAILLFSFPFNGLLGQLNTLIPFPHWVRKMEEDLQGNMTNFLSHRTIPDLIANLFMMAAIPALCEEAFFRGAFQRILIQAFKKPWPAIIITGAAFSFIHFQFLGFFPRMSMGILLGAVYYYSGSIWPAILAHFFINGSQIYAVWLNPKLNDADATIPVWTALLSLAIIVGLLALLRNKSTTSVHSFLATDIVDKVD